MRISVIVPAHGAPEYLDTCLDAIGKSSCKDFEVIVVDDGSTIPLRPIVAKHGFTCIRLARNHGAATARNIGASHAAGDILLFIDSDVRVHDDTISRVSRAFEDPQVNVYQGLASKTPLNKGFGPQLMALRWYFQLKDITEASFVYSHVFSIRKRVFDEIGGFNESFKPPGFGDEFELGTRLRKKHVIHVDPKLLVDHKFQGIMARTRSLYHRSYAWARILAKTGRFEKANASSKEAIIGAVDLLMVITIPAFLLHPGFILVPTFLFLIQAALNRHFYSFLRTEKGIGFAIKSVIPIMTWSIAQVLGGMHYLIKHALGIEQLTREGGFKLLGFRLNKQPSHLVLFVTARCNARCRHCFYWQEIENASDARSAGIGELTLAEIRQISRNMGHVEMLTITGGEPSLRDDLPAIMDAFYKQNDTRHVTIHTNGFLGEPLRAMLTAVLRSRPLMEINVSLSIDGLKETHDKTRGIEGSYERAMQTLKTLERLKNQFGNLSITVNTVFTRLNQDEIVPLVDHVYTHHDIDGFYIALVRGNPREPAMKDVAIEKYRSAIKHLGTWKARRGAYGNYTLARFRNAVDDLAPLDAIKAFVTGRNAYPCKAGQTVIVISERGDVSPCEMMGFSIGNLRDFDHDLGRILASARAKHIVKAIKGSSCSCTWECAVMNNIVFNWRAFPRVALQVVKNLKSML